MSSPGDAELDRLATGELDADDVRILRRVARVYDAVDPVPPGLVDRLAFGITLDALHAEIAELQRDDALVGVRGADSDVESVTFTSASLTTMITLARTADRVRIDGWIAPGAGVTVELRVAGEQRSTTADEDGRFVFDDVPQGLAQFVLRAPSDARPVVTPPIQI
jgi:hypothetical protein